MTFGLSGSAIAGIASAGLGLASANAQRGAAQASEQHSTQMAVYQAINEQANLNNTLALLRPFVDAGQGALGQQRDLLGLNGNDAQQGVISGIQNSPLFQNQIKLGENSILQNASATGGLRGGNTQAALAQFSPAMLSAEIQNRFQQLGGLVNIGQNAAVGSGNAGQAATSGVNAQLAQIGASQSASALAQGRATSQGYNSLAGGLGMIFGGRTTPNMGDGISGSTGGGGAIDLPGSWEGAF